MNPQIQRMIQRQSCMEDGSASLASFHKSKMTTRSEAQRIANLWGGGEKTKCQGKAEGPGGPEKYRNMWDHSANSQGLTTSRKAEIHAKKGQQKQQVKAECRPQPKPETAFTDLQVWVEGIIRELRNLRRNQAPVTTGGIFLSSISINRWSRNLRHSIKREWGASCGLQI